MSYSVEHSNNFHMARRIVKVIAPDFRVFATEDLAPGCSVLDLEKKTIEVPDFQNEIETVALILFQAGHLRLKVTQAPGFEEHFGTLNDIGNKRLVSRLSRQGATADQYAAEWAMDVLKGIFGVSETRAKALIEPQVWDEAEWREYYS
jgi:hypothetical protein